jgi:hypothetical protein
VQSICWCVRSHLALSFCSIEFRHTTRQGFLIASPIWRSHVVHATIKIRSSNLCFLRNSRTLWYFQYPHEAWLLHIHLCSNREGMVHHFCESSEELDNNGRSSASFSLICGCRANVESLPRRLSSARWREPYRIPLASQRVNGHLDTFWVVKSSSVYIERICNLCCTLMGSTED